MRSVFALLLALIVALSSVTMATARHQARASDRVVLCTGMGMVTLALDDRGNPVGPMLPCPDCTPPLLALDAGTPPLAGPPARLVPLAHPLRALPAPPPGAPGFHWSRGPPARV